MTKGNLLASLCGIIMLTGCATKEAAKIDSAAQSIAIPTAASAAPPTTTTDAPPSTGAEERFDGHKDSVLTESVPRSDLAAELAHTTRAEAGLATVYFDFDSYLLGPEARDTLARNARWLKENRYSRVVIEGHADERGSDDYNLALSEKRALAARRYIQTLGVRADGMESVGYGEEKPAVPGHDDAALAKNRRVEFVIVN